ncbi:Uncharacterised protein [Mycobacteroides abscessus subsp. abscessus]|nr:Uncharacterised protein [Mycobacteroides abscessus subsp. abscessus]
MHMQISPTILAKMLHSEFLKGQHIARLRTGFDIKLLHTVKSIQRNRGTQRGCRHRNTYPSVKIVALAHESRIRINAEFDIQIPVRTAGGAGLTFTGKTNTSATIDTCRNLNGQRLALADTPLTVAFLARMLNDGAKPLTGGALYRLHDSSQDGLNLTLHITLPLTGLTGFRVSAGFATVSPTNITYYGGVNSNWFVGTKNCILQINAHVDERILPLASSGCRSLRLLAEESFENI